MSAFNFSVLPPHALLSIIYSQRLRARNFRYRRDKAPILINRAIWRKIDIVLADVVLSSCGIFSPRPWEDSANRVGERHVAYVRCMAAHHHQRQWEGGHLRMLFCYVQKCAGALVKVSFWCGTCIRWFSEYGCSSKKTTFV